MGSMGWFDHRRASHDRNDLMADALIHRNAGHAPDRLCMIN